MEALTWREALNLKLDADKAFETRIDSEDMGGELVEVRLGHVVNFYVQWDDDIHTKIIEVAVRDLDKPTPGWVDAVAMAKMDAEINNIVSRHASLAALADD